MGSPHLASLCFTNSQQLKTHPPKTYHGQTTMDRHHAEYLEFDDLKTGTQPYPPRAYSLVGMRVRCWPHCTELDTVPEIQGATNSRVGLTAENLQFKESAAK